MAEPDRPLAGVDPNVPNIARVYDYLLGGKDNFAVDRETAEAIIAVMPDLAPGVRMNRVMLTLMVRYLAEAGIRQFVDIGAGLPTQESVHQVAHRIAPDARVAYVDNDPVVVLHGQALLGSDERVRVVQGDLRRPKEILTHPEVRELIDFDEPVAVLLIAIVHLIGAEAAEIIAELRDVMVPGSYMAMTHFTGGGRKEDIRKVQGLVARGGAKLVPRTRAEILRLFDGFDLVPYGESVEWNIVRDTAPDTQLGLAFVGRVSRPTS